MSNRIIPAARYFIIACFALAGYANGQTAPIYQSDFPSEELAARRTAVMKSIGSNALAVIQGAADSDGFDVFRQSNTFYYLTGLETPQAYLALDGRNGRSTLYLPYEDPGRERGGGKVLTAEDAFEVRELTGVDSVKPVTDLARDWIWGFLVRGPKLTLYAPLSPAEVGNDSRDERLRYRASVSNDPWDGEESREFRFVQKLHERYPGLEVYDLSPVLDRLRSIKSPKEIALIRKASRIAGQGLVEAMRCTAPGVYEYQLEACASYIYQINGTRRLAYSAIVGGGPNAFMGHYFRNNAPLKDGDLVLMDFAPDYHYYASDVTRMFPVNGTFSDQQLELYNFIVAYRAALMEEVKPGITSDEVLDRASVVMRRYVDSHTFSKPTYKAAVEKALAFRGHMQHPVGMAVHDVGNYKAEPLSIGEVFSIDPMLWVPEERLYVRIEDVVTVTGDGLENFTEFLPVQPEEIEEIMRGQSLLSFRPPFTGPEVHRP